MTLAKTPVVDKRRRRSKPKESAEAYWQARARLRLLKRNAEALAKEAGGIYEMLKRIRDKTMIVHALPHAGLALPGPTTLSLRLIRGRLWEATLADLPLTANGMTEKEAARAVLRKLASEYLSMEQNPSADPEKWHVLTQLVRRVTQTTEPAPAVTVDSEVDLTAREWLDANAPELKEPLYVAWRRGACARLYGRKPCRYNSQDTFAGWNDGFAAMSRYLEAGGVLACNSCLRALRSPLTLAKSGDTLPASATQRER